MTRLSKHIKYFEEMSIRLDQSYRDGKTIVSTRCLSLFSKQLAETLKEVEK